MHSEGEVRVKVEGSRVSREDGEQEQERRTGYKGEGKKKKMIDNDGVGPEPRLGGLATLALLESDADAQYELGLEHQVGCWMRGRVR